MDLSPDEENFPGRLLHQAALWDNVELLEELLSSGADVDARDHSARTALHAAALCERSRCLAVLCARGADVGARSDRGTGGKTALHISAERGHSENVTALLSAGADVGVLDARGDSALALAERHAHRHAARVLRDARDAVERERLAEHARLRELVTRGADTGVLRARLAALGQRAPLVANMTPAGANTLLYVASEAGLAGAASALLEAGADGRAHPVTSYGPLYIAAYHGHRDVAALLLRHFPEAVQQETVEKWLPLHAACIGGHAGMVTLLLEHPYPAHVMNTYTDASGQRQYKFAFDVNARDASGQSALYVACTLGNLAVVEALLNFTLPATSNTSTAGTSDKSPSPPAPPVLSPQRGGISLGIHAIVSKLTGSGSKAQAVDNSERVRPVRPDAGRGRDSCVAACVRGNHARVLRALLAAGASADASAHCDQLGGDSRARRSRSASAAQHPPSRASASPSPARSYVTDRDGGWTALALAARDKNTQLVEMLLSHGASDPSCRALRECSRHGLTQLVANILATKAYADPDYKLNKSSLSESVFGSREGDSTLTYSGLCPSTPVMVNWRELRCQLHTIRMSWLRLACLRVNARLSSASGALLALTRVDVSNNELRLLPAELFTLTSLRYLNAAQNKLERLPSRSDPLEDEVDSKGRKVKRSSRQARPEVYSAPVLQELYLQDNRLEELPSCLFSLLSLQTLDVSNNKLRALPVDMWSAPSLRDLNAALNHLRDLPTEGSEEDPARAHVQSPTAAPAPLTPSPSVSSEQFALLQDTMKSSSRSPSISSSTEDLVRLCPRAPSTGASAPRRAHAWRGTVAAPAEPAGGEGSTLAALNLAHNQFTCVPAALACRARNLARLNMSYNSLRSMSYVTSYPTNLRQLDLSHNEITCWPSLPPDTLPSDVTCAPLACHCPGAPRPRPRPRTDTSVRHQLLSTACPARRHLRLEGLRTLVLANNMLTRIQLTTDDDGELEDSGHQECEEEEWGVSPLSGRLLFPMLSMLDVSCNLVRRVPPAIHALHNLAVLNLSGNKDITDLPPQMGLLSRLWNLNTSGCSLQEPLRSMVGGGRYKSMDIIGYLLSVLQEAHPYTRMKLMFVGEQAIGKTSLLDCLRQESGGRRGDHWSRRMGNRPSKSNMSTVGVDIGAWTYEKGRGGRGPITFRTWDFGGQQEYYATHQYFLSRRSLYLVLWRVTAGRRGLGGALRWLRGIQARAPGSPCILVATHYDRLDDPEGAEALQRIIRTRLMGAPDADKLGLPRILDSVEVSCKTRHNIRLLADLIYSCAWSLRPPPGKELLLEQRVPATYLALEDAVTSLAAETNEPVLRDAEFKRLVTSHMQSRGARSFRDAGELRQAVRFLHEQGVLLHYDSAQLKELYFIRPQWLADLLAHIVTVREVNPFNNNGIMRVEDLSHVFKASPALGRGEEASSLAVSLLNKFELALCWDARVMLVPSLLPATEPDVPQLSLRTRCAGPHRARPASLSSTLCERRLTDSPQLVSEGGEGGGVFVSWRCGRASLRRLLLLSYVPVGFWARLTTRLLADHALADATQHLYPAQPTEMGVDECMSSCLQWSWKLWRAGVKLQCAGGEPTLLAVRERSADDTLLGDEGDGGGEGAAGDEDDLYRHLRIRVKQEGVWCSLDVRAAACVELVVPNLVCVLRRHDNLPIGRYHSISLEPNPEVLARVLALVADHVDLLLEDWYPALGTRFVHTSEGRCLITRVVPCPACLRDLPALPALPALHDQQQLQQALRRLELCGEPPRRPRLSEESRASDGDSGVGAESNASSRLGSVEGVVCGGAGGPGSATSSLVRVVYGWTVEECILSACTGQDVTCQVHCDVTLRDVAPDTLLLDVPERMLARWEQVVGRSVCGRGAFGTVLAGTWRTPARTVPVAVKTLQPVPPPAASEHNAYKAALSRWERDPLSGACRAYCGLRQELTILSQLHHPHVVPLVAVCAAPLALLLALAPMGALDGCLRTYRGCGARVGARAARALTLQVARALEYLHAQRIVYRDLKSENVLVWRLPAPAHAPAAERDARPVDVLVKLGDYGISRLSPPSGTKGFGGTEGFMAPEIMRYNGEEEYNEKVDCFSFGMLLYEVVTLRQPFEGHEAVKEAVLEGARPALAPKDLSWGCCVLETMRRCWSSAPAARPSAAALVAVLAAPEYTTLQDAAAAPAPRAATPACVPLAHVTEEGESGWEIWFAGETDRVHTLIATSTQFTQQHTVRVPSLDGSPVSASAVCRVGDTVWVGDTHGRVHVYCGSSCALLWSVSVEECVGGGRSPVSALLELGELRRVALALRSGRLFLVMCDRPAAEGSFVLTELGTATMLCCLAAVDAPRGVELWAGGDGLSTYELSVGGVRGADALPAGPVSLLAAAPAVPAVFSCDDGVSVCMWSVTSRNVVCRLDVSKLAPCSESLLSSAVEEQLQEPCRVTSLCASGGRVCAGTSRGGVVVCDAEGDSMRPLTVFRPHDEHVLCLVPLRARTDGDDMLVTLGNGYRPLLQRFTANQSGASSQQYTGYYSLLWRAHHWLPD